MEKIIIPALAPLAERLFDAKQAENEAKEKRIEVEEEIAALVETGDVGSCTVDAGNGIRVTVKRAMGYKVDMDLIRAMDMPDQLRPIKLIPAVPAGYEFDAAAYEALRKSESPEYHRIAQFVTATPKKTSVAMKLG